MAVCLDTPAAQATCCWSDGGLFDAAKDGAHQHMQAAAPGQGPNPLLLLLCACCVLLAVFKTPTGWE